MEGVTRSMRRREMGDIAMCLRDLNHARASSTVGGVVWRAVTRGYYPVETIVELYIKATLGDTTAMFMYPQDSMGYGDGVVGVSWRGRVERVAMGCGLEAAMAYSDGYKHMFFGDLVT